MRKCKVSSRRSDFTALFPNNSNHNRKETIIYRNGSHSGADRMFACKKPGCVVDKLCLLKAMREQRGIEAIRTEAQAESMDMELRELESVEADFQRTNWLK